jgi:tRNA pseudouridine55 synthase
MATGVLPLLLGKATKAASLLPDTDKTYEAAFRFGEMRDTGDVTGEIVKTDDTPVTEAELRSVLPQFTGDIMQVPPMYSALKVDGKRLYELAREGKEVERKPREVEIFENTLVSTETDEDGVVQTATLRIRCSKGTYIRSLLRDIGEELGCGACMASLVRIQAGQFFLPEAVTLSQVEQARDEGRLSELILPIEHMLSKYPKASVKEEFERYLYNGNPLGLSMLSEKPFMPDGEGVRVYDTKGALLGFYRFCKERGQLLPDKMFLP